MFTIRNNVFSGKSRATLLWMNIITICAASALLFSQGVSTSPIVVALISIVCGIVWCYIQGNFLRTYYENKKLFVETLQEQYDDIAGKYLFIFYFIMFLWIWIGNAIVVAQMAPLTSASPNTYVHSSDWVLSIFLALLIEWAILDPLTCVLIKSSPGLANVFKWKGYIYDEIAHTAWKNQKKVN